MDRGRMKTFVLCLLLAVNLTFLGLIIADRLQAARLESEAREELVHVLYGLGISLSYDAIPNAGEQALYLLTRDIEAERQVAARVLQEPDERDEGGGIYHYFSDIGTAQFRAGSFRFDFADYAVSAGEGIPETGFQMLRLLDLQVRRGVLQGDELSYILTFEGLDVVGAAVHFTFSGGYLQEITGPSLWGASQRFSAGEQVDVATALMRLAGYLQGEGAASRFAAVRMGYYLLEGPFYLAFRPVWIVETDTGVFSIDRQTGEIRS